MTQHRYFGSAGSALLVVAAFVVVVAGMKAAQPLIVPFLLSIFIAIVAGPRELSPLITGVEIYARENDDVIGLRRMWVLRTSGLAQARAEEAKLKSSGGLRVDTFR